MTATDFEYSRNELTAEEEDAERDSDLLTEILSECDCQSRDYADMDTELLVALRNALHAERHVYAHIVSVMDAEMTRLTDEIKRLTVQIKAINQERARRGEVTG